MIEEPQLQVAAVDAMRFEPLVLGFTSDETFKVPTGMQSLSAPVRRGEERYVDLVPERRAGFVIVVVERMGEDLVTEAGAVLRQLGVA